MTTEVLYEGNTSAHLDAKRRDKEGRSFNPINERLDTIIELKIAIEYFTKGLKCCYAISDEHKIALSKAIEAAEYALYKQMRRLVEEHGARVVIEFPEPPPPPPPPPRDKGALSIAKNVSGELSLVKHEEPRREKTSFWKRLTVKW